MIAFKVDYDGNIKCLVAGCKGQPYRFNRNGKTLIKCPECGAIELEEENLNLGDKEEK